MIVAAKRLIPSVALFALIGAVDAAAQLAPLPAEGVRTDANQLRVIDQWRVDDIASRVPETATVVASVDVSAVLIQDADWTRTTALEVIVGAARILAQCGVRLRRVDFRLIEAPRQYRMLFNPMSRQLAAALRAPRPAVYFVQDTMNQPEFAAEAFGRRNSVARPELTDSVWLTAKITDPGVAFAHELAHVLMDDGSHVAESGNLMRAEIAPGNTRLSREQCTRLVSTGVANDLLRELRPR
jgi:hypothetical protein